jgi:hypothetical protein
MNLVFQFSNGGVDAALVGLIGVESSCRVHGSLRNPVPARLNKASELGPLNVHCALALV